jgi:hypothetical protein
LQSRELDAVPDESSGVDRLRPGAGLPELDLCPHPANGQTDAVVLVERELDGLACRAITAEVIQQSVKGESGKGGGEAINHLGILVERVRRYDTSETDMTS